MYWHIDTDIVALIVLLALYVYTVKMLPEDGFSAPNTGFLWCLRAGVLMTACDIAASVVMEAPTTPFLYHLLMSAYFLTIELAIVSWFLYSLTILYPDDKKAQRRLALWGTLPYCLYALLVCTNPWTGLIYTLGADLTYTRTGLFLPLVVGMYAAYALFLLLLIFLRRKHIPAGYPAAVLFMQPVLLSVAIPVQLLNAGWLMILPAYMICLVLAFLFFENQRVRNERALLRQLTEQVEHFACGLAICEITADRQMHVQYLSEALAAIYEEDSASLTARYELDILAGVYPEDRERVRAHLQALAETLQNHEMTYRILTKGGNLKWINVKAQVAPHDDGSAIVYATYTDLTEQKMLHQQLRDVIQNVPCGICIYRWDGDDLRPLIVNARFSEMLGEDALNYLKTVDHFDYTHVHPDDLQKLKHETYVALTRTHILNITYRSRNAKTGEYLWIRMRGKLLDQADGSQLVLVSYNDVTAEHNTEQQLRESEKELWAKYELEKSRVSLEDENLLAHAVFNLSTDETLEYLYRDGSAVPMESRDFFAYSQHNAELLIDEAERRQFLALNNKEALLERFARGETEFRLDYRRLLRSGEAVWVRSALHLLRDPRSADILLFAYWYNIEEEKMLEAMYRSIASDNYDYVARINGRTRQFVVFPKAGLAYHMPPGSGEDADAISRSVYNDCVLEEDRERVVQNSLVGNIRKNLQASGRFQFTYRERQPDGSIRYKKITQYYIDAQRDIIAMLREDVSEMFRKEMEKNAILADALAAANQASDAKSQFLSRVSHELRTPLNAIIGFMELAKDADSAQLDAYLANVDVAAKQLLSIINDVLDVSSIESGKMKLAHAPFDFKHLIHSITNIFAIQCQQKGLQYETRILTPLDEWLLGDQLRVNQILLNLLGNAVKFTADGHVFLTISQHNEQNDKVRIRFEISDTGCGMSEEMQARLFKPFEQENASTAQKYGGSGLGLSIVGSLVSMMNGVVRMESRQGEGSAFIVDLPFTRSKATPVIEAPEGLGALRVLAVDDEALERDYISIVLKRIGVRHTCVADGVSAMAELARGSAENDAYNICLIDWKMPDMNGIEITQRIRETCGEQVVVIVVSAYEHEQADVNAKAAGANMFISKPLFQSSLLDLFSTLTGGRIAAKDTPVTAHDFAGRRILLAEDNAMNRTVAEGLIKKFGVLCDTAADGQIAADKFLAARPGYYDAILMDIQMPTMDGFAATRVIRESAHADAQTVPIIALTANAFNEDIAKSLASGMNAHVAKPIEPKVLAAALHKAFADRNR